ncbi:hypothetical protein LAZ67_5004283, partial [Cordylochernes scorpioides]
MSITRDIQHREKILTGRQQTKMSYWVKKYQFPQSAAFPNNSSNGIVNLSSIPLSEKEERVLALGLHYVPPDKPDIPRLIAGVEGALKNLNHMETLRIRHAVIQVLRRPYHPVPYARDHRSLIQKLKKTSSLVITKADKGNQTVLMDRADYEGKMMNILADTSTFTNISTSAKDAMVKGYKSSLRNLMKAKQITKEQLTQFTGSLTRDAYIYGAPKIHKPGVPLRPIIAYHLSPAHTLAKYLAQLLSPIMKINPNQYNITHPPSFVQEITQMQPPAHHIMVSFDVTALYLSLPHALILNKLQSFLKSADSALEWYADEIISNPAIKRWEVVKEKLIQRFGSYNANPIVSASHRRLKREESIENYFLDKIRLLNQTHLTKEEKNNLLTDGLPNDWKDLIVAAQPTDTTKWFHIAASIEQNRASIQFKPKNKIHLATKNNDSRKNVCPFWCPICSKKGIKIKHWVTDCEDYDPNYKKDRPNQNTSVKQVCGAPELLNVSTLTNTPTQGAFKLINISVEVNGIPAQAFVDTGATVSIINWRLFKRTRLQLQPNSDIHISQADGVTRTCGSLQTKVRIDKLIKPVTLHVMKNFKYPLLIGLDVASLFNLLIDVRDKTIYTKFDGLQNPILVNHLEEIREHELKELLEHNRNVFSQHAIDLGKVAIQHKIITKSEQPISLRPYRRPLKEYEEIAEQVKELLEHKLIRISDSPWAFPVVMVPKKDGNKRMCIDYRRLNEITLDDRQPLPHIQDMFDRLHGSRFFSTLDVAWGYWQIEMDPQSIQKTAFVTNDGHYEFLVMPFGLKNAASTFQRIIQHILGELLWKGTCSFQDDILVYTKTWQEHIELLSKVFDKLRQYNMKLKLSKCIFGRTEVKYLGHIISHNQLKPDPGKVKSIQDFPRSNTVKKVRQFMGLANYYKKFVKDFSKISFPLVRLTRKNQPFIWNEEVEESFAKLKMALSTKPVLAIYNPDYPSKVYTDASKYGIGAILTQIGPDNEEHVIAYYSKTLQPHQENYSAYEMECLAVIQATDHFHVYIENQPFEIITDHAALQWLFTMKKPKPKYFRWILSLSSKSCNIVHRSGKQQTHVDALSRLPVVNIATQELQEHQQNSDLSFLKNSHTHDGVVMIKQRGVFKAVVPNSLTKKILEEYHDSLSHPSITKTCKLITQCYWWKGITTDIKNYVRSCKSCQLVKVRHEPTLGEMITPTSNIQPLQMIGCDTIVLGTAAANTKHKFIQVFVDHATRYLWAYPTITNTAQAVTQCLDKIIKSVNSINTILTDNGKNFISKEFNKFLSLQGIKHTYTSPYHPQCNGICEKLNDTIMTKLRIAVLEKPRCKWSTLLPQVVKNYNSTPHDVTGFSPLFLMYGIGNVPEFADQTPITIEEARKKASLRTEQFRIAFYFQTQSRVLIIPNCMLQLPLKRLRFNQISPFASNNKKPRNDIATERLSRQDSEMELNQDPIGVKSDGPTETMERRQEVRESEPARERQEVTGREITAPLADAVNQLSTLLTRVKISDGAESAISPFDGTYSATQFFQTFDRKMEDASMEEQEKLLRLPNYLVRQPLELFRKLRLADRSYFQVRQTLLDLYPESSEASFAKYFAMKLTGQTNLETYYREKTAMGLQLGLPQEVILETLTEGLPFSDQRLVRVVPPENLGEWFRLVQRIHGPSVPATRSREDQPPTMSGPYHSTPRRPGAWNAPLPPSNCKFCGARHWHSECRLRPVPKTHEKVRTVQTVPKQPATIPQQPTPNVSCPFFTKANCPFYMPSNNQTTTTSTYEPVQNAPTQRDNSHTKNVGDHTPLHNSHMTNPHNELDTHTNTQQNPLPHAYYNTTSNTHYTPQFTTLLQRYTHIFSQDKFNVPCLRIPPVKIPTNSEKIITIRPYRVPICDQQEIRNQIQQMLENGIIEQSFSPFSSPVTLVTKRDKTKRFSIDYRKVNELISSDVHPLPRIEDILDRLAQAKYFSTADISSAYWQVPIHPDSRPLLAFATFEGLYQPTRLPFGLKTSPQIYERAISQVLQRHGLDCVAHYFDDFIIYSNTLEEHQNHLRQFFAFCEAEKLQLNFAKCEFFKQSINFLGYTITAGTITPLTRNTDIIHAIKQPHNRKTLQSFLGAVNVYNKFIPEYARLRAPLNNLLKKDVVWNWNEACQEAFIDLKGNLTQHPILHLYKEGLPCQVYCDASTLGIAGILKQVHPDGNVYPVQYFSRTLRPHEKNYSISELECLAIVESVEKFRIYLMGRKFTIFSDHHALQWLKTIKNPSGRLFRWSLRLSSYEYEVRYIKGKLQYEADLLSRNPFCGFLDATLIKTHQPPPSKESSLTIDHNGLHTVSRKGITKIIIPKPLIQQLLQTVHTQYNHPGISQMSLIISTQYYWQGMSKDIKQKVKTCPTCQLTKRPVGPTYGELSQPPESKEPFDLLSLDTIAGFAKYGNTKIYLHVVVDHFSRYAWAFPSKSTSTTTYQQVLKRVFQDGSPKRLLTDRAPAFTSPKFRSFLLNRNIHPLLTTSNNPQANGLCERLNATLTGKLRLLHLENPKVAWTKLVKKVTLIYNKTPHSTTGFPPIYLMFGILPPEISNHNTPYPDIDKARKIAHTRTQNKHLQDKNTYDQRHKQPHFEVGDLVLVKLYHHPNTGKLAPYFTGPHTILEIISPNVVRIDRPNQPLQRDTDTIHVNKLKLYTEKIHYISPPAVSTYHIKHNPNYTFPFKHLTPELFQTESLRFKSTSSEPFRHLDPAIFATRRFTSLFPDVKNCKPDNQLNHITPLPKDIKQENCEPTNHSNSTIHKVQANISESPVTKMWTNMGQYPIFHLIFILCLLVLPYNFAFYFQTQSRVLIIPNCMLQLPLKRLRFNQISPFASNNKKPRNDIATERLSRQDSEMELNQDPIGVKSDGPTETMERRQEVRESEPARERQEVTGREITAPLADAVNQLSTLLTRVKISDGAESAISPFDGTYSATQFFQTFDRKMEDASMEEQEKLLRLPNYLVRQPLELFRKLRLADRSYFQVRQTLLDLYPESSEASFAKYFAMKLTGQTNLETYYREKTAMGLQLGLPQEVILETLTEGLPFSDQRLVRVVPPENLGEWFRLVQRIHGPSVPATRSREDQPPTMSGPYHSTPRRPGAWNAPLPPSNCKFCGARHWHSECRLRPVPKTHEKVRTVQTVPKQPATIPQQPTPNVSCPFFTKANCPFYMPSNNQTTTTSTYEPVQNAPTQRDNSHTKNVGDHTPLHNSHMTNPHNELDTHTNTQQNPLPHAYYNTTSNTHYTPQFTTLLQRYTHIFSQDKFNVPCLRIPPVKIPTNSEKIITIRPYRVPICDQQEIRNQIQQMLENGIIEQSFSPFSSPVTLVTKRDKTKRFSIDYRKVNELISSDVHPLPRIEDILDRLAQAKYFSTADISSAYWQVPIHPDSRPLLAFATFEGLYQPTRLPFGLKTSPQIYERAISQVLQRHGLDCVAHYFDDFIIYSNTLEEHQNHLRQFFAFCEAEKLQLNFAKCEFFKQSINFLGYTITAGTITPLTRNTDIIHAIKQPHNRKTLQSFLGAVNVYNKFIPEYARLRAPLNNLLKKDVVWNWNEACQEAFIDLKGNLTQHPILHLYKEGLPCQVYCDASTLGIAGILKQVHPDGNVYPVQYFSRTLRPHEKNYSISELECLAIVESVEKFRIYLMGRKFTIFSDHHALQWLKTIKNPSGRLFRWSLRLSSYEYEVRYIKGKLQYEADLLSRNPFCGFLDATLIKTHQPPPSKESSLTIDHNGLHTVSRKGITKIIIPKPLIQQLLQTVHTQYNHPGISQMSLIISTQYYWQGMSKDIKQKVKTCPTCQLTKRPVGPTYGELSQPPESKEPFDLLSLDTIAGFAKYGNTKIYLHVVVDHFSRYAWAFPSKSTSTTTYQQVLKRVFQDGSPKRLLTDRAPAFTSPKFRSFLLNRNIHPLLTTSNNPQANGLCERLNATLTGKLRLLHLENPKVAWTKLVKKVTLIYNKTPHSTTGFPPIYLMFGILPPEISNHNTPYPDIDKARKIAHTRTQNKHLQDKNTYDQRHKQPHFEVGDLVLVKLYHHPNTGKLAPYFTGPHTILEIISPNVVRIDRPNQPLQRDTDTIHVNKLKLYTEKIHYISPPAVSTYHIKHNPNYTFPFKHLTPELFQTESLRFKSTSSEPFRHLDPAIFATRRFTSLFPDVKNCKPDNQLNHITPLPKDIKQENCEPTNHSNSTIHK